MNKNNLDYIAMLRSGSDKQVWSAFLALAHEKENLPEYFTEVHSCLERLLSNLDSNSNNGYFAALGIRALACLLREYSLKYSDRRFLIQFENLLERALLCGDDNAVKGVLAAISLDAPMHGAPLLPTIEKIGSKYKSRAVPPIWCWQFDDCVEVVKDPSRWCKVQNKNP